MAFRRALRLYAIAAATHLRLDNATQVQTTRAAAQDALRGCGRQRRAAAGVAGAHAARHPHLRVERLRRRAGSGRQRDRRLHRRDPRRRRRTTRRSSISSCCSGCRPRSGTRRARASAAASVAAVIAEPAAGRRARGTEPCSRPALTLLSPRAAVVGRAGALAVAAAIAGGRGAPTASGGCSRLPPPPPRRGARARRARRGVRRAARADRGSARAHARPPCTGAARRAGALRPRRLALDGGVGPPSLADAARSRRRRPPSGCERRSRACRRASQASPTACCRISSPSADRPGSRGSLARASRSRTRHRRRAPCARPRTTRSTQIPGAGYFDPRARSRVVVVLTDGESSAGADRRGRRRVRGAAGLPRAFVRFWRSGESIYDADGRAESAYRPDPAGGPSSTTLASALGGSAYERERARKRAGSACGSLRGQRARRPCWPATVRTETPLAPFTAGLALLAAARTRSFGRLRASSRTMQPHTMTTDRLRLLDRRCLLTAAAACTLLTSASSPHGRGRQRRLAAVSATRPTSSGIRR